MLRNLLSSSEVIAMNMILRLHRRHAPTGANYLQCAARQYASDRELNSFYGLLSVAVISSASLFMVYLVSLLLAQHRFLWFI
jgi:hypothetical protein